MKGNQIKRINLKISALLPKFLQKCESFTNIYLLFFLKKKHKLYLEGSLVKLT